MRNYLTTNQKKKITFGLVFSFCILLLHTATVNAQTDPAEYSQMDQICPSTTGESPATTNSGAPASGNPSDHNGSYGTAAGPVDASTDSVDTPADASYSHEGDHNAATAESCASAVSSAQSFCTASNSTGIANQAAGMASIANASSANAGAACTMQSKIAAGQALFAAGVAAGCTAEIVACRSACDPATVAGNTALQSTYQANSTKCMSFSFLAAQATAQAAGNLLASKAASACAKAYSATLVAPTPVLLPNCLTNPAYAAANQLTCYCQSNPGDSKCLNAALAVTPGGVTQALTPGGIKVGTAPDSGGLSKNPYEMPAGANPPTGPGAGSGAGGGGFGGGGGGSGAATAASPEDAGTGSGSSGGGNIFGGFSAGQGGFSYGHAPGDAAGGGIAGAVKSLANKFNLNGLLPKRNDYINRSVAGMSVSAKDGVTGPNGPSIWEKVSRRYQIKKGELLPP